MKLIENMKFQEKFITFDQLLGSGFLIPLCMGTTLQ